MDAMQHDIVRVLSTLQKKAKNAAIVYNQLQRLSQLLLYSPDPATAVFSIGFITGFASRALNYHNQNTAVVSGIVNCLNIALEPAITICTLTPRTLQSLLGLKAQCATRSFVEGILRSLLSHARFLMASKGEVTEAREQIRSLKERLAFHAFRDTPHQNYSSGGAFLLNEAAASLEPDTLKSDATCSLSPPMRLDNAEQPTPTVHPTVSTSQPACFPKYDGELSRTQPSNEHEQSNNPFNLINLSFSDSQVSEKHSAPVSERSTPGTSDDTASEFEAATQKTPQELETIQKIDTVNLQIVQAVERREVYIAEISRILSLLRRIFAIRPLSCTENINDPMLSMLLNRKFDKIIAMLMAEMHDNGVLCDFAATGAMLHLLTSIFSISELQAVGFRRFALHEQQPSDQLQTKAVSVRVSGEKPGCRPVACSVDSSTPLNMELFQMKHTTSGKLHFLAANSRLPSISASQGRPIGSSISRYSSVVSSSLASLVRTSTRLADLTSHNSPLSKSPSALTTAAASELAAIDAASLWNMRLVREPRLISGDRVLMSNSLRKTLKDASTLGDSEPLSDPDLPVSDDAEESISSPPAASAKQRKTIKLTDIAVTYSYLTIPLPESDLVHALAQALVQPRNNLLLFLTYLTSNLHKIKTASVSAERQFGGSLAFVRGNASFLDTEISNSFMTSVFTLSGYYFYYWNTFAVYLQGNKTLAPPVMQVSVAPVSESLQTISDAYLSHVLPYFSSLVDVYQSLLAHIDETLEHSLKTATPDTGFNDPALRFLRESAIVLLYAIAFFVESWDLRTMASLKDSIAVKEKLLASYREPSYRTLMLKISKAKDVAAIDADIETAVLRTQNWCNDNQAKLMEIERAFVQVVDAFLSNCCVFSCVTVLLSHWLPYKKQERRSFNALAMIFSLQTSLVRITCAFSWLDIVRARYSGDANDQSFQMLPSSVEMSHDNSSSREKQYPVSDALFKIKRGFVNKRDSGNDAVDGSTDVSENTEEYGDIIADDILDSSKYLPQSYAMSYMTDPNTEFCTTRLIATHQLFGTKQVVNFLILLDKLRSPASFSADNARGYVIQVCEYVLDELSSVATEPWDIARFFLTIESMIYIHHLLAQPLASDSDLAGIRERLHIILQHALFRPIKASKADNLELDPDSLFHEGFMLNLVKQTQILSANNVVLRTAKDRMFKQIQLASQLLNAQAIGEATNDAVFEHIVQGALPAHAGLLLDEENSHSDKLLILDEALPNSNVPVTDPILQDENITRYTQGLRDDSDDDIGEDRPTENAAQTQPEIPVPLAFTEEMDAQLLADYSSLMKMYGNQGAVLARLVEKFDFMFDESEILSRYSEIRNMKVGRYSSQEDGVILKFIDERQKVSADVCKAIGALLYRDWQSVRRRARELCSDTNASKMKL